jgi:hypothetical protein
MAAILCNLLFDTSAVLETEPEIFSTFRGALLSCARIELSGN